MANINWFGKPTKPTKQNKKQVSFLGLKPAKKTNYLGLTGKYGDRDMDGSPNLWDCSPKNPAKDGLLARALGAATGGLAGQTKEQYKTERSEKRRERGARVLEKKPSTIQRLGRSLDPYGYKESEKRIKEKYKIGRELTAQREIKGATIKQIMRNAPKGMSSEAKKLYAEQEYERRTQRGGPQQIIVKVQGAGGKETKMSKEEKRKRSEYKQFKQSVLPTDAIKRNVLSSPVIKIRPDRYNLKRIQTARAKAYASSPYQQQEIERIKTEVTKRNLGGRPTGTYTHSIPGVGPVHVYVWRKWMRQQKALARLRASQIQPQNIQTPVPGQVDTSQMSPEEQQMMQQYQLEQQQMVTNPELEAQTIDQLPAENKFTKNLQMLQAAYQREQYNRLVNEQPKGFVQQSVRQRQLLQQQAREFSRRNNLLHAHKAMLTPQENKIDFLNTSGSEVNILDTRNNNIMASRPDSIDLLNTGRRNILQADKLPDVSQGNIMNAERLNFGKINLTKEG